MYHSHRNHSNHHGGQDSGIGCLLMALVGIFALPIVGMFLLFKEHPDDKALGAVLMVVGIVIWVIISVASV